MNFKSRQHAHSKPYVLMKTKPQPKQKKLLLNLMSGERQRHSVALVTEEGEWNQHEPNTGMARMFVVMLIVHVILIVCIIAYDFMDDGESPQQAVTQAARAMSTASGLPQAAPGVVNAQAQAAADTQEYDKYEMRSGDSLKNIAVKFGSTEEEITKLNMIDKGLQIGPGTMLRVPKQPVLSAIPVDPNTLRPMTAEVPKAVPAQDQPPVTKVPSEAVKPTEAPASLAAATLTPMSLVVPGDLPPTTSSLAAAADTPATAPAPPPVAGTALPPPSNPHVVSLLQENAPVKTTPKAEPPKVTKAEPPSLAKPRPVLPPTQMLKKIAEAPPTPKKLEPVKKSVTEAPPKAQPKTAPARTHSLQSGETLYRLASKYGVSVDAIQKANNIKNPNAMREGLKLVIPAK